MAATKTIRWEGRSWPVFPDAIRIQGHASTGAAEAREFDGEEFARAVQMNVSNLGPGRCRRGISGIIKLADRHFESLETTCGRSVKAIHHIWGFTPATGDVRHKELMPKGYELAALVPKLPNAGKDIPYAAHKELFPGVIDYVNAHPVYLSDLIHYANGPLPVALNPTQFTPNPDGATFTMHDLDLFFDRHKSDARIESGNIPSV